MKSKIVALSNNEDFKSLLRKKKVTNKYTTIFYGTLKKPKNTYLNISFVVKKRLEMQLKETKLKED